MCRLWQLGRCNNPLVLPASATQQHNLLPVVGHQCVHFSRPENPPTHLVPCRYGGCLQDVSGARYRMPIPERHRTDGCVRGVSRNGCSYDSCSGNVMIYGTDK
uniref:Uncharacterized protein n=1 Tax=Anopheles maculatus TaxID=74869 RepID=A0A182SF66_9DIPT